MSANTYFTLFPLNNRRIALPAHHATGHFVYDDSRGHELFVKLDAIDGHEICNQEALLEFLYGPAPLPTLSLYGEEDEICLTELLSNTSRPLLIQALRASSFLQDCLDTETPKAPSFWPNSRVNQHQLATTLKLSNEEQISGFESPITLESIVLTVAENSTISCINNPSGKVKIEVDSTQSGEFINVTLNIVFPNLTLLLARAGINPQSNTYPLNFGEHRLDHSHQQTSEAISCSRA